MPSCDTLIWVFLNTLIWVFVNTLVWVFFNTLIWVFVAPNSYLPTKVRNKSETQSDIPQLFHHYFSVGVLGEGEPPLIALP